LHKLFYPTRPLFSPIIITSGTNFLLFSYNNVKDLNLGKVDQARGIYWSSYYFTNLEEVSLETVKKFIDDLHRPIKPCLTYIDFSSRGWRKLPVNHHEIPKESV
jgi:hypothetical protein